MTRQAQAVVCREINKPVVVEAVSVDAPQQAFADLAEGRNARGVILF